MPWQRDPTPDELTNPTTKLPSHSRAFSGIHQRSHPGSPSASHRCHQAQRQPAWPISSGGLLPNRSTRTSASSAKPYSAKAVAAA
jgi:hypothetical protein